MNIYDHFACHTRLPVKVAVVKAHVLESGCVAGIIRKPVSERAYAVHGGLHLYWQKHPDGTREKMARIGYPTSLGLGWQRLIQVKEMLHCLDPDEATSPTKVKVEELIVDLIQDDAERKLGTPASADHNGILHALCILLPRDALDEIRPAYKRGHRTIEQIADEAKLPTAAVEYALSDRWRGLLDKI